MKKKIIIIGVCISVFIGILVYLYMTNREFEEYIPQEEISKEDSKMSTINLYFQNSELNTLEIESRKVYLNDLLLKPYETIIEELIKGPENANLKKLIPDGVILNSVELENYCLKIDFSRQFIENCEEDEQIRKNIIDSIFNTVTQINEVSSIKILIDGVGDLGFPNGEIKF